MHSENTLALDDPFADWLDDANDYEAQASDLRTRRSVEPAVKPCVEPVYIVPRPLLERQASVARVPFPFAGRPRHFPALLSRSSLFRSGLIARPPANGSPQLPLSPRPLVDIKSQGSYRLKFEGPRLGMRDKLVFENVAILAKEAALDMNDSLNVSLSEVARKMGWRNLGGENLKWIWESLVRLSQSRVEFDLPHEKMFGGRLLASVSKSSYGVKIQFDKDFIMPAFGADKQFLANTNRMAALESSRTQWMHDFLQTHSASHDLTLGYLRDLCGFESQARRFPEQIVIAMTELCLRVPEIASSFDLVKIGKSSEHWILRVVRGTEAPDFFDPTRTQSRHEAKGKQAAKPAKRSYLAL